jgi:hypothetical protein
MSGAAQLEPWEEVKRRIEKDILGRWFWLEQGEAELSNSV